MVPLLMSTKLYTERWDRGNSGRLVLNSPTGDRVMAGQLPEVPSGCRHQSARGSWSPHLADTVMSTQD